jgi:hypothetical protein
MEFYYAEMAKSIKRLFKLCKIIGIICLNVIKNIETGDNNYN